MVRLLRFPDQKSTGSTIGSMSIKSGRDRSERVPTLTPLAHPFSMTRSTVSSSAERSEVWPVSGTRVSCTSGWVYRVTSPWFLCFDFDAFIPYTVGSSPSYRMPVATKAADTDGEAQERTWILMFQEGKRLYRDKAHRIVAHASSSEPNPRYSKTGLSLSLSVFLTCPPSASAPLEERLVSFGVCTHP